MSEGSEVPDVGQQFTNAKIVGENIDPEAYHKQVEGVKRGDKEFVMSRSELMLFDSNPNRWVNGYEPKDSDAKDNGSLVDCYCLDLPRFRKHYVVTPETCTATKNCKAVKDGEFREGDQMPWNPQMGECKDWKAAREAEGLIVLSKTQMEDCIEANTRLMSDPILGDFIDCSKKQVMIVAEYHDKATKLVIPCKMLLDLVPDKSHPKFGKDLGDLKTTRNAAPRAWNRAIRDYHYDVQAAMFRHAYIAATGEDRTDFCHLIQENLYPWQPARRRLGEAFLRIGALVYSSALRRYSECLSTGNWPSWDDLQATNGWGICYPEEYMLRQL